MRLRKQVGTLDSTSKREECLLLEHLEQHLGLRDMQNRRLTFVLYRLVSRFASLMLRYELQRSRRWEVSMGY